MAQHLKKDGTPDMRYSSSKAATPSGGASTGSDRSSSNGLSARTSASNTSMAPSTSRLHFKDDGTLDMRFSSSKNVLTTGTGSTSTGTSAESSASSSDRRRRKDGGFDMRFNVNKNAAGTESTTKGQIHNDGSRLKKDGTPDKRFNSKKSTAGIESAMKGLVVNDGLHYKKDGTPDMRYKVCKLAVEKGELQYRLNARDEYWENQLDDPIFAREWSRQCRESVSMPPMKTYFNPDEISSLRNEFHKMSQDQSLPVSENISAALPNNIPKISYSFLEFTEEKELGKGAFGVVRKARWNSMTVAVKELHLPQLTRKEKPTFEREVRILARLGKHVNLVQFYGYCLEPPCIIMEYVNLGNLSYLLHYCEERSIEVKMADGRVKKKLIAGIVDGMQLLHDVQVVHGDVKPTNILINNIYTAKITDFGLASFRGKTSSTENSNKTDNEETNFIIGTGGYMAPELLLPSPPDYASDVYSFGVLLNEVVTEEEPYSDQWKNFVGPLAAVIYAKSGKRPKVRDNIPAQLAELISACWNTDPKNRPTFVSIQSTIRDPNFVIPNWKNLP